MLRFNPNYLNEDETTPEELELLENSVNNDPNDVVTFTRVRVHRREDGTLIYRHFTEGHQVFPESQVPTELDDGYLAILEGHTTPGPMIREEVMVERNGIIGTSVLLHPGPTSTTWAPQHYMTREGTEYQQRPNRAGPHWELVQNNNEEDHPTPGESGSPSDVQESEEEQTENTATPAVWQEDASNHPLTTSALTTSAVWGTPVQRNATTSNGWGTPIHASSRNNTRGWGHPHVVETSSNSEPRTRYERLRALRIRDVPPLSASFIPEDTEWRWQPHPSCSRKEKEDEEYMMRTYANLIAQSNFVLRIPDEREGIDNWSPIGTPRSPPKINPSLLEDDDNLFENRIDREYTTDNLPSFHLGIRRWPMGPNWKSGSVLGDQCQMTHPSFFDYCDEMSHLTENFPHIEELYARKGPNIVPSRPLDKHLRDLPEHFRRIDNSRPRHPALHKKSHNVFYPD